MWTITGVVVKDRGGGGMQGWPEAMTSRTGGADLQHGSVQSEPLYFNKNDH
jgi:hypothetical protein